MSTLRKFEQELKRRNRIERELRRKKRVEQEIRFRYGNAKCYRLKYHFKENFALLKNIRKQSVFDWKLIQTVRYEEYICWSYPNFKQNKKFETFSDMLDLGNDKGTPKCIIKIVQLINEITMFNKKIRQFFLDFNVVSKNILVL